MGSICYSIKANCSIQILISFTSCTWTIAAQFPSCVFCFTICALIEATCINGNNFNKWIFSYLGK